MRKLMWFTVGFGAGCAFFAYFDSSWVLSAAFFTAAAAVIALMLTRWFRTCRIPAAILTGLAVGCAMFYLYDQTTLADAKQLDGQIVRTTVVVRDYSYDTNYGCAFDGTITLDGKLCRVRVYLNDKVDLEPGNRVIASFQFKKTTGGGVDEVLYHRGQGIFLLAYQKGNAVIERCWSTPWRDYPAVWRQELKKVIDRSFPEDTAGFAKALLLGDRMDIDYETNTAFKVSGISHIIAVSGLHVSILFGLVYFMSGRRRFLTTLLGVPVVLIFAAVAGFTPSITRAAIMQILMMLSLLCQREYDPPTALGFSALVMLIVNPLVITSVSFQLSFACMAGIFSFSDPIRSWLLDEKRLGKWDNSLTRGLSSSVAISISSVVFTTPLVAVCFGAVSLVSILTNLLTLWVITFIFYGIMAVCVIGFYSASAASALAAVVSWPIRFVLWTAKSLASFPLAAVYTRSGYIVAWLVFVYILLVIWMLLRRRSVALFGSLAAVTLCSAIALSCAEPLLDDYRMTMLDVGQGQAILLQSDGKTFLVDCGGDDDETAADVTAETLLSQGITRLDGIILTHYDRDHAGGLQYLLTRIDVDLLMLPYSYDENGVGENLAAMVPDAVVTVMEDQVLTYEDTKICVFAPVSYNSGNESSMCVLFQTENCDILITGDMGLPGERLLMKYHDLPQVDVLVAGHHGSKDSTGEALLRQTMPEYVFISVGEDNRYGHPAPSLLQRLLEFGCIVFRTDESGTIIYRG